MCHTGAGYARVRGFGAERVVWSSRYGCDYVPLQMVIFRTRDSLPGSQKLQRTSSHSSAPSLALRDISEHTQLPAT